MAYYIDTECIEKAYDELTSIDYSNHSILHIFFILKGIGINQYQYVSLNKIKEEALPFAQSISSLFSPFELSPEKCDFINPFLMRNWATNPTELLTKWVNGRIKNNIVGGATTWRKFIMYDSDENFKFTYDYIEKIKKLTLPELNKISLPAFAIWANRFTFFENKVTLADLCDDFLKRFHINENEKFELFKNETAITSLKFNDRLHDTEVIRSKIGNPQVLSNWINKKLLPSEYKLDFNDKTNIIRRYSMENSLNVSVDLLKQILNDYHQIILSGPPGTSKSFYANELGKEYDFVKHVQFHPQYTYQQFVGGYLVDKTNVIFEKGLMCNLIEEALKEENKNKKFLLIIDEINRANTSQVFGDLIQCLDRNNTVSIMQENKLVEYTIPKNIHIVGTMNTTDRTIGIIDYALKRRFLNIYCPCNANILIDLCPNDNFISLSDLLNKINIKLFENLKNKDYCVGHAIFLNPSYKDNSGKYIWDFNKLEIIFNFKILPLIEEYCSENSELIANIIGNDLPKRLSGNDFKTKIMEFLN